VDNLAGIKHIICIASGKGGVGKSTTAINLSVALHQQGLRVGLLDADIYGPSQPLMLGVAPGTRPEIVDKKLMRPVMAHGLATSSIAYLVAPATAMVWRAPMIVGAFNQMLKSTLWGELDFLIIDLPPGTGDIQLSLTQAVGLTGAVIVTTPQDVALLDARKGIEMFRKVKVPLLGVVENMSVHICSNCGHAEAIFGAGGGERLARDYGVSVIGSLPLDLSIREHSDAGTPLLISQPDSAIAGIYHALARQLRVQIETLSKGQAEAPVIEVTDD
jgi:ATP-binding protein involved in chromosome partitioning